METLEISLYFYGHLNFNKGAKTIHWSKQRSFQQMVSEQLNSHMQKERSNAIHKN